MAFMKEVVVFKGAPKLAPKTGFLALSAIEGTARTQPRRDGGSSPGIKFALIWEFTASITVRNELLLSVKATCLWLSVTVFQKDKMALKQGSRHLIQYADIPKVRT